MWQERKKWFFGRFVCLCEPGWIGEDRLSAWSAQAQAGRAPWSPDCGSDGLSFVATTGISIAALSITLGPIFERCGSVQAEAGDAVAAL